MSADTSSYLMYTALEAVAAVPGGDDARTGLVDEARAALDGVDLQEAYHRLVGSTLGAHLEPVWSQVGTHRPVEFNRSHLPAYLMGCGPGAREP